jgi:stage V sporulation protein B
MSKGQKSFVREAAIISVSNFIVKIIGVLYKIPLANILSDGMGIFNAAYSIYAMLFMISTSGLPVAISRTIAASAERGRTRETKRILKMAVFLFGIVGVVCTLFLILFAEPIAVWSKHEDSVLAMKVIAPTLFFICVTSAYRGYFQGQHNMYPTAISQFIEAFLKMVLGLGGVVWAQYMGYSVQVQAAYAILGLTVGTMCSMIFLVLYKKYSKRKYFTEKSRESIRYKQIAKKLVIIALPVTITSSALYLSQFLDTLIIKKVLIATGVTDATAEDLYSAYTTLAISISDLLPSTLVYPIAISILPAVAGALALNKRKRANGYIITSIRISGIIAIPCSICLFVLARPCIALIYGAGWSNPITMLDGSTVMPIDIAAPALSMLAIGIFFISLLSTTTALLQAIGKMTYPMISVGIGVVFLTILETSLTAINPIGIYGAPIASVVCYIISLCLNMRFLRKAQNLRLSPKRLYLKPFVCALITGICCFIGYRLLYRVFDNPDGRLASLVILLITGIGSVLLYAFLLLLVKGITANEVRLLPLGNTLCDLFIRKGWLQDSATSNNE